MIHAKAVRIFREPHQIDNSARRLGYGTWYKLIHDPDGFSHFYGFMSASSFKSLDNWLPGTRFRKFHFGEDKGVYEIRQNGAGNEMVRM